MRLQLIYVIMILVTVVAASRQQQQQQEKLRQQALQEQYQRHRFRRVQDRYMTNQNHRRHDQEQQRYNQHRKTLHNHLSPKAREQKIKLLLNFLENYLTYYDSAVKENNSHKQRDTKLCFDDIDFREKSINMAIAAAKEAEATSNAQQEATEVTEIQIKHKLAKKAMQSAFEAQAALVGKLELIDQIKLDISQAKALIDKEIGALRATEFNVQTTLRALNLAERQISDLMKVMGLSQTNLATSEALASHAQRTMATRMQFVETAKNHLQLLRTKFNVACKDYEQTRTSAYRSALAAVVAKATAVQGNRKLKHLSSS